MTNSLNRRTTDRDASATRKAFWQDKADNAAHCATLDAQTDAESVNAWLARFQSARNNVCEAGFIR
jgi:hypothetical protein